MKKTKMLKTWLNLKYGSYFVKRNETYLNKFINSPVYKCKIDYAEFECIDNICLKGNVK